MIILEDPYVSPELATFAADRQEPVLDTPAARQAGLDYGLHLNLVSSRDFGRLCCQGQRLYSNSENSLDWLYSRSGNAGLVRATERLSAIDGVRIYGTSPSKCSIVSFNVEGAHAYDVGMILDKLGIAIRTGAHCADPLMTHFGITGTARASFAFYNTPEEADALAAGVERAARMLR